MSVTSAMQAKLLHDETKSMDEAGAALVKALGIDPPGAWVKLASAEMGRCGAPWCLGCHPPVAVLLNKSGMPTGEPIPRDTAQAAWKIAQPCRTQRGASSPIRWEKLLAR